MVSAAFSAVAIERRNSLDYLRIVCELHARGQIVLPMAAGASQGPPGIDLTERLATKVGGGWFDHVIRVRHEDAPAQISLTSGTTGTPKAILLSHRALGDVTERLLEATRIDSSIREYVGVPVDFSFGFGRVRAVSAAGGASFIPANGFRIDELAAMLNSGAVNALSAVPTLLRLLIAERARLDECGRNLRWLEIGSQAMSVAEKKAIRDIFPNARIVQHYGLTEASRSTFLEVSDASDDGLEGVGRPNGSVEIRVTEGGKIAIRGPHVADGMILESGLAPLKDNAGWLITNDLGRMTPGGLLFEGRADDLINVGGIKIPAEQFEQRLNSLAQSEIDFAVARGDDHLRGELVIVGHAGSAEGQGALELAQAAAQVAAEMGIGDGYALFPMDKFRERRPTRSVAAPSRTPSSAHRISGRKRCLLANSPIPR